MVETIVLIAIIVVVIAGLWYTRGVRRGVEDPELRALDVMTHISPLGEPLPGPEEQTELDEH